MSKDKIDPDSLREKNVTKNSSKVSQSTTERKRLVLTQKETNSSSDPKNKPKPPSNTLTKKTSVKSKSVNSQNSLKLIEKPKPASRTSLTRQSSLDTPSSSSSRQVTSVNAQKPITHQNQSKISNANVDMAIINSSITPRKSVASTPRKVSSSSSKPQEKLSSRVTKEKYFPKGKEKTVNGFKEEEKQKSANDYKSAKKISLSRERTQTKITTETKRGVSKNDIPKINSSKSEVTLIRQKSRLERPTTSTIRKREKIDSDSQSEMSEVTVSVSHASTIVKTKKPQTTDDNNDNTNSNTNSNSNSNANDYDDDNYEDDFESYESDFEEYESSTTPTDINTDTSSTESEIDIELKPKPGSAETSDKEQKLDSGTYDLPELKHKQVLDRIKEAIEKENQDISTTILKNENHSLNLASLSDEGFDEKFSMSNGFINFNTKSKEKKKNPKNKRGDELTGMIRLDSVTYNLFDMKAISYDAFIKTFGRSGTVQVSSQTGDDNLDIDIQTDPIELTNKWTQFPIRIPRTEQNLPYNHLGVGGDDEDRQKLDDVKVQDDDIDTKKLDTFISYAGNLILNLLETKNTFISKQSYSTTKSLPFSEGFFNLNVDCCEFLIGREVTLVEFSTNFLVLTVHKSNTEVYMNPDEQLLSRSLICIWSLLQPMKPQKILAASGEIRVACFDCKCGFLVFAGISDGSVCVWDLREPSTYHRSVYEEKSDHFYTMRCPTYTTSSFYNDDESPTQIIAIKAFNNTDGNTNDQKDVISMQICTLDELGTITIWSAIQRQHLTTVIADDQGLVPWGNIALVQSFTTNMQKINPELKELHCYDLQCSNVDNNHLYIASNYGVLHCLTSGMKPKPKIYMAQTDASKSVCCVEMCPYSSTHFLAGSSDGCVRLHSRHYERALMNLKSVEENNQEEKVEIIQWSQSRPCVFYVKDSSNFVHVWDLLSSDMFPIYSIPFREEVTCIKLSPVQEGSQSYMAISTKKGSIFLHTINEKFGQSSSEQFTLELKTFLNYVNRL